MAHKLKLFDVLKAIDRRLDSKDCKIHLASWNGRDEPLDVYFDGDFENWQGHQNQKNFTRPLILSLISMPGRHKWLFEGVHRVIQVEDFYRKKRRRWGYFYTTERCRRFDDVAGRTVVHFERTSRQSYLNADRWSDRLLVDEIKTDRMQALDFPGYLNVLLTKNQLDSLVRQQNDSWRSALSSVSGVYVITDRTDGCIYVGSATGERGIWGRWSSYARTGHGGNKDLKRLLRDRGDEHADNFQYAILETGDSRATQDEIMARESHWKQVLLTREFGLNSN
ncbi:MAG: GIY-YIG nuclease family protein [Phycisphaerales bacterium JB043]